MEYTINELRVAERVAWRNYSEKCTAANQDWSIPNERAMDKARKAWEEMSDLLYAAELDAVSDPSEALTPGERNR
jgi:hypothetical protein